MDSLYRFSARRQFVNHTDIKVTVKRHGKRARYRCGCHHQHMRTQRQIAPRLSCLRMAHTRQFVLLPQLGTLRHTKTVLFVDDHQSQTGENHIVLYHCMSAYKDVDVARHQVVQQCLTLLALDRPRQQFHPYRHIAQE